MRREEDFINELKNIMNTLDGRDFIYNFILMSCGVDYREGIPSIKTDEFNAGRRKPAIDLFNLMFQNCPEKLGQMLSEQRLLNDKGENNGNEY